MNLTFTQINGQYVAEVTVEADFNIHIEKSRGYLLLKQRTPDAGEWADVKSANFPYDDLVVDCDFAGAVYPKSIQVICEDEPTLAVITSSGNVTAV